mmetsp:Transcript_12766/g.12845  ORF Transcript_12766/g.12845 Transcript_12766/m.12845 type:complete len:288 (+) Transcript_12766:56-919(+)
MSATSSRKRSLPILDIDLSSTTNIVDAESELCNNTSAESDSASDRSEGDIASLGQIAAAEIRQTPPPTSSQYSWDLFQSKKDKRILSRHNIPKPTSPTKVRPSEKKYSFPPMEDMSAVMSSVTNNCRTVRQRTESPKKFSSSLPDEIKSKLKTTAFRMMRNDSPVGKHATNDQIKDIRKSQRDELKLFITPLARESVTSYVGSSLIGADGTTAISSNHSSPLSTSSGSCSVCMSPSSSSACDLISDQPTLSCLRTKSEPAPMSTPATHRRSLSTPSLPSSLSLSLSS